MNHSLLHLPGSLCPACRCRPVRCRGLCKSCRRQVARGLLAATWLPPRRPPGPTPQRGSQRVAP